MIDNNTHVTADQLKTPLYSFTATVTGALTGNITVFYKIFDDMAFLSILPISGTATASTFIQLSNVPSALVPRSTQEEFFHVQDAADVKVGTIIIDTNGILKVYTTNNTGDIAHFQNNQLAGWSTKQSFHYPLY